MTTTFQSGCKYRRGDWLIEVYYNDAGDFVARNPRDDSVVLVSTLPADGWERTDEVWRRLKQTRKQLRAMAKADGKALIAFSYVGDYQFHSESVQEKEFAAKLARFIIIATKRRDAALIPELAWEEATKDAV